MAPPQNLSNAFETTLSGVARNSPVNGFFNRLILFRNSICRFSRLACEGILFPAYPLKSRCHPLTDSGHRVRQTTEFDRI